MFVFLFSSSSLKSQTVKLDTIIANYGDTVLVPLQFYNFSYVGALTLFIIYDADVLEYVGMTNLVPEGQGTLTNAFILDNQPVVGIAWSAPGTTGVDFPNGKYLDLKFVFSAGSSNLVFFEQYCEIVDWDVNLINCDYIDGMVDHLTMVQDVTHEEVDLYSSGNQLFMNAPESGSVTLTVFDIIGRTVHYEHLTGVTGTQRINMAHLEAGIYIVKANINNKVFSKKVYINNNY